MTSHPAASALTPTTLTARCPEDLLAMAPVVLGFVPTDSVVMLTFDAEHVFHARVDLPRRRGADDDVDGAVGALLDPARRHRVRRVVFVLYSDDAGAAAHAWRGLRRGCQVARIHVVEALRTDGHRWYPLLGGDRRLREIGAPYDVGSHPFLAQAVLDGRVTHASRDELAATLTSVPQRVAVVAALVRDSPARDPGEHAWVEQLVSSHTSAGSVPTDPEVARLLTAVQKVRARDAALSVLTRSSAPDHVSFWSDVVRRTPDPLVAAPAAVLAWAAWQAGDGALAWCALDRCALADPGYPLMTRLAEVLTHAVPPSAWEGCT